MAACKVTAVLLLLVIMAESFQLSFGFSLCHGAEGEPTFCNPPLQEDIAIGITPEATSTCGVESSDRVCSIGSVHKCDMCDSSDDHPTSFITDGLSDTYWQSRTYRSVADGVNVSVSFGKAHYVESVSLVFQSPRPESFGIFVSSDGGSSYEPVHFFSQSCEETYGILQEGRSSDGVGCVSDGSGLVPLSGGQATFQRPVTSSPLVVTDILIKLDRLSTLGNELTWSDDALDSYFYAISSLSIKGGCFCNGHSDICTTDQSGFKECLCQHNTMGKDCEMCLPTHNDAPWRSLVQGESFECKACKCSGRAEECTFDPQAFLDSGNKTGSVCNNCSRNTTGSKCQKCAEGFFPLSLDYQNLECRECVCDPRGIIGGDGTCATATSIHLAMGSCPCKKNVKGSTCNTCEIGYHSLKTNDTDGCQECNCTSEGSIGAACDELTGQCLCKAGYHGRTCQPCDCNPSGVLDLSVGCRDDGKCECKEGFGGEKCDNCLSGYYNPGAGCIECSCHRNQSLSGFCDSVTGQCPCRANFSGRDCSECPDGLHNINNTCIVCQGCYKGVSDEYSEVVTLLEELILQTNSTLSSSRFHSDLVETVNSTRISLMELLEIARNLSNREIVLNTAVNETTSNVKLKSALISVYSKILKEASANSMNALTSVNTTKADISNLFQLFALFRTQLFEVKDNLTNAYRKLADILLLREELAAIANSSVAKSKEQNVTVADLLAESEIMLDNTTEALASVCELLESENATLVHLRGVRNCTLPDLDKLLVEAETQLYYAIANASEVLNASIVNYDRILNTAIPKFDSQRLINDSQSILEEAIELESDANTLINDTVILQDFFIALNSTVHELTLMIDYLNSTAKDLVIRAETALSIANDSTVTGEKVIEDVEFLFNEIKRCFEELSIFLAEYNSLLQEIARAENRSEIAVSESTLQYDEVQRLLTATGNINETLQSTVANLDTAMKISEAANRTAISAQQNAQMMIETLKDLQGQIDVANESVIHLSERAETDRSAINSAETVTNTSTEKVALLEKDLNRVVQTLNELEEELNNVTLVSESRYLSLKSKVDSFEITIVETEESVGKLKSDLGLFEKDFQSLEKKYLELRRHRDLLNDIKSNIQDLNCYSRIRQ